MSYCLIVLIGSCNPICVSVSVIRQSLLYCLIRCLNACDMPMSRAICTLGIRHKNNPFKGIGKKVSWILNWVSDARKPRPKSGFVNSIRDTLCKSNLVNFLNDLCLCQLVRVNEFLKSLLKCWCWSVVN